MSDSAFNGVSLVRKCAAIFQFNSFMCPVFDLLVSVHTLLAKLLMEQVTSHRGI